MLDRRLQLLPNCLLLALALATAFQLAICSSNSSSYEYCIVGAGPSGLQLAHLLHSANPPSNYVVLERAAICGSFFARYPRHDRLISINKRWTDSSNTEYLMRHDWNSLLSDTGYAKKFGSFSDELFPPREAMLDYLRDFCAVNNLTVHFNTTVTAVSRSQASPSEFHIAASANGVPGTGYNCQVVVMATGLPDLQTASFEGHELTVGYDNVSVNATDFEGKRVLIVGKGNSGFETAQHVYGHTRFVHLVGRSPLRFAWSSHYVGDLRAVNNQVLDTYQLKSLDGNFEVEDLILERNAKGEICATPGEEDHDPSSISSDEARESDQQQYCYDVVIRATGFVWDSGPTARLNVTSTLGNKYPLIGDNFESVDSPGIYFAGTATHSLDFRRSAGGFVHGFRYTARALHRLLRARRLREPWPAVRGSSGQLLDVLVKRINEGSGTYQMLAFLGDVVLISGDRSKFTLLDEVPVKLLPQLPEMTGHRPDGPVLVFVFEYGRNFSGPRADTFRADRADCQIDDAHRCNFLHPVLYLYDRLPDAGADKGRGSTLPKPDRMLHLVEDFYTNFRQPHQLGPLVAFLESCLAAPTVAPSMESCTLRGLLTGHWPGYCPTATDAAAASGSAGSQLRAWSVDTFTA